MNSRRDFLGATVLAAPLTAASRSRVIGASDRINVGVIGAGGMGTAHMRMLKRQSDAGAAHQVTAVSDIYARRKLRARDLLGLGEKDIHHDYRDLLARSDVDAVFIVTPDHWHFRMAIDALEAGKDVYLQKPMSYKVEEAKVIADTVRRTGRVLQVGSQYASEDQYHKGRELIQQGVIGKPLWAQGTYCRNTFFGEWNYRIDEEGTAENIDWKRFLGGAPRRPFSAERFFRWRKYWDYSGGIATDLLYHRLVPFLLALGPQFPVRVSSNGGIYVHKDREVPDTVSTTIEYEDFQVVMSSSMAADLPGAALKPAIYGNEGTMEFRGREIVVIPEPIHARKSGRVEQRYPAETKELHAAHVENFFACMRSRRKPNLDADFGYKTMVAIGLGVDAYRESRQIAFDPATGRVLKSAPRRAGFEGSGQNTIDYA